jgi:hypothetical protein
VTDNNDAQWKPEIKITIDVAINCTGNTRMKNCVHIALATATAS